MAAKVGRRQAREGVIGHSALTAVSNTRAHAAGIHERAQRELLDEAARAGAT